MSSARTDLLKTLDGLEQAAGRLVSPVGGQDSQRSADYLLLNGLHVIAFSAVEDFIRRRAIEVVSALTHKPVTFRQLPDGLQLQILQEWIKGMSAYLQRADSQSRTSTLLYEAEVIGTTAGASQFVLSDYSFGRSQSNISLNQITNLLTALNFQRGLECLREVAGLANLSHLGAPDQIFTRLMENRHSAAHSFGLDFKLAEFLTDMKAGLRALAFTYDTCISQAALVMRKAITASHVFQPVQTGAFKIRAIRFDSLNLEWSVSLGSTVLPSIKKEKFNSKREDFEKRKGVADETIFVVDGSGKLKEWFQPI